jgi:hypothetical protein
MTTYYGTYGQKVQYLASDPASPQNGQVWFNSTSNLLKVGITQNGAFATGGNLSTGRSSSAGTGEGSTQNAAGIFGGGTNATEEYDGTSWTAGGNLPITMARLGGAGTQTSSLAFAGEPPGYYAGSFEYDGSSWTAGGSLATGKYFCAGNGTQTAALAIGGSTSPSPVTAATEEYNGTAWTAGGNLSTARRVLPGTGTQTAAIVFGGQEPIPTVGVKTEQYDGTSWSNETDLPTAIAGNFGTGTQTAALSAGGYVGGPGLSNSNLYDGTAWTAGGNLNVARRVGTSGGAGSQTAAVFASGEGGPATSDIATEEFTGGPTVVARTVTGT